MKEKILEITEIARACPENLQTICFELLLKDYLSSRAQEREGQSHSPEPLKRTAQPAQEEAGSPTAAEGIGKGQDDLSEGDLHVKARRLLEKNSLTVGQLNNLFYKENGQILPLYEDLKTAPMKRGPGPVFTRYGAPLKQVTSSAMWRRSELIAMLGNVMT